MVYPIKTVYMSKQGLDYLHYRLIKKQKNIPMVA